MTSRSSFGRRMATGLLAAHLCLGSVALAGFGLAAASAVPAAAEESLPAHGAWPGFHTTVDGESVVGAITEMSKGGGVAFAVSKGKIGFWMWKKDWTLPVGKTIPVTIKVGGDTYRGTAIVKEANFVAIENVGKDVVEQFMSSSEATLDFADVEWTLDLEGFTPSVKDALNV